MVGRQDPELRKEWEEMMTELEDMLTIHEKVVKRAIGDYYDVYRKVEKVGKLLDS